MQFNSIRSRLIHPCWRFGLVLLLLVGAAPAAETTATIKLAAKDMLLSPEVVVDTSGGVRLAQSVLIADEIGATDFHQAETLSERIRAKKIVHLDREKAGSAELFIFHGPTQIHFNGKPLEKGQRLVSTGWTRWKVPAELLRKGDNEIVLFGGGNILIEPNRQPGRSMKSSDGGLTWSPQLGKNNDQRGEYLVRLRLNQSAAAGWAMTPVLDLWAPRGGIATPGKVVSFKYPIAYPDIPIPGAIIQPRIRTGSTPTPDAKSWTDWLPFKPNPPDIPHPYRPDEKTARHRWLQLRFDIPAVHHREPWTIGPQLDIQYTFEPDAAADQSKRTVAIEGPRILQGSTPFVHQEPSPRLKLLRERHQLDKVIAPGKTEMEQLMLLRFWVRNQWHTAWEGGPASWMPPWDTLIILESKDQSDCLTMCTHYAAVFTQCCVALGWNARHCILDHHCVSEVWVDQHQKWVMMDAGNSKQRADVGLHFERNRVPQSALELLEAHRSGKTEEIQVCFTPTALVEKIASLCRPAPKAADKTVSRPDTIPLAELKKYPVCQIENYRRYAFPARNNYLSSLLPGELYQGWSEYFYDGYCWVGDSSDNPQASPEYSRHLSRPQDVDWSLNWTRAHLSRTAKADELQVDLETHTPNLARLERWEDGAWKPTSASFVWKQKPGENELRVRSVNRWDRAGTEMRVKVK